MRIRQIAATLAAVATLSACSRTEKTVSQPVAISDLSKLPVVTGGKEWSDYWAKARLVYPEEAKRKKLEGYATVQFTVDENGKVVNMHIAKATDTLFAAAALAYMDNMPPWHPAEKYGHKIAMDMYQPFLFTLGYNGATTVMTVSADTSRQTIQCFAGAIPSGYTRMLNGSKESKERLKEIEHEMKKIDRANKEISKARKEISVTQEEIAKMYRKKKE